MGAVRDGGAIHTEGDWFAGGGSWVATSHVVNGGIGGSDDVDYYGGHLIGESISSCNIPIISAAPDMFKALLAVKQKLHFIGMPGDKVCKVTGKSDWSDQIKLIESALTKAVTRVPVPAKVVPVEPVAAPENDPDCVGAGYRLIGSDEFFIAGDQFDDNNTGLPKPLWLEVESNIGRLKRDSTIANNRCRRKVEPVEQSKVEPVCGEGYREVGDDEVLVVGDQYFNSGKWWAVSVYRTVRKAESTVSIFVVRRKAEEDVTDGLEEIVADEVTDRQKPPLGLMPRQMWLENRRDDIYDAIARYRTAGKDVSRDWLNELLDLDNEMRPF